MYFKEFNKGDKTDDLTVMVDYVGPMIVRVLRGVYFQKLLYKGDH